jgi:hypothetical protein
MNFKCWKFAVPVSVPEIISGFNQQKWNVERIPNIGGNNEKNIHPHP